MEESLIYNVVKERYDKEQERKDSLNGMISIPISIFPIILGALAYFFNKLPADDGTVVFCLFWSFLILSCLAVIVCIGFFLRHQTGYKYAYLPSPKDLFEFEKEYRESLKNAKIPEGKIQDIINEEARKFLYKQYAAASEINVLNNEKKLIRYRNLIISIVITVIFLAIAFAFRMFLPNVPEEPIAIERMPVVEMSLKDELPVRLLDSKLEIDSNSSIKVGFDEPVVITSKDVVLENKKKQVE